MSAQATVLLSPSLPRFKLSFRLRNDLQEQLENRQQQRHTHTGPYSGTHTHTQVHTHSHRELYTTVENRSRVCSPACLTNPSPLSPLWHSAPGCLTPCTPTSCCCPWSYSSLPPLHSSPQQPLTVGKVVNLMSVAFKLKLKSWVGRGWEGEIHKRGERGEKGSSWNVCCFPGLPRHRHRRHALLIYSQSGPVDSLS